MKISNIIAVSQIFQRGTSKMRAQAMARHAGASGSHAVAQRIGIHSDDTYKTYRTIWEQYADFAKTELGILHVERSTPDSVRLYLEQRIEDGIERRTWNKESSAMNKFAVALNWTSEKLRWDTHYDFGSVIDNLRSVARQELHMNVESRAYQNPPTLISAMTKENHNIAASMQYEGGARIREISDLAPEQFRGIISDRITGERMGVIHIDNGKGGYERDIFVSLSTYERAKAIAEKEGSFSFSHCGYRSEIKQISEQIGENYSGSHGLRWNYAQEMMKTLQQHGHSYEQALQETSERLGHHRMEITEHYLQ